MSYFFCNFANIYIQIITKSNKMDINIFTPPVLKCNITHTFSGKPSMRFLYINHFFVLQLQFYLFFSVLS